MTADTKALVFVRDPTLLPDVFTTEDSPGLRGEVPPAVPPTVIEALVVEFSEAVVFAESVFPVPEV